MKLYKKRFYDTIYHNQLFFLYCEDYVEARKVFNKWIGIDQDFSNLDGMFLEIKDQKGIESYCIYLYKPDMAVVLHELLHFVIRSFANANIKFSNHNDEHFNYYVEHWYRVIKKFLTDNKVLK